MIYSKCSRMALPWIIALTLSGCAAGGLTIPITDPQPTKIQYRGQPQSANMELRYEDARPDTNKTAFSNWIVPMRFEINAKPLDPAAFIAENTTRELISRGLPIRQSASPNALPIRILMMGIENHRLSGFSPMVTLTSLIAETDTLVGKKRISVFIKRGKVPVWSFDELNEPCYNEPMNLLTKELAAKINREIYGLQISDADVDNLFRKVAVEATTNPLIYFDVYQLGFGNNPKAIPGLVQLTSSPHEYIRLAAISSLGTIKARDHLPLLISLYRGIDAQIWQDRAIALKAIGDLDTKESRQFILDEFELLKTRSDKGSVWMRKVLALYLNQGTTPQVVQPAAPSIVAALPARIAPPATPVSPTALSVSIPESPNTASSTSTPATTVPPSPGKPSAAPTPRVSTQPVSAPAAAASTAQGKTPPASPTERQLTGSELKNHFSTPEKVIATTNGAHTLTLDFQKRGGLYIILTHPASANPLTNSASGEYSVKENQNQICLQGHSSNKILKGLWDCYSVYDLDNNTYTLRAMDGTSMTYQRGSSSPPNIQRIANAATPQADATIPQPKATQSPAIQLTVAEPQTQTVTPSPIGLPPVTSGERLLTGEALRNHFAEPWKTTVKTKTGQMISLDFRTRNTVHLGLLNRSVSNVHSNTAVGDYSVKEAQNQVCLTVRTPTLDLRALWDCFSVYAQENNSFEMRARDGTTLSYKRNESWQQNVRQAPITVTPQGNAVIAPAINSPSPTALLPVTGPLAQSTAPGQIPPPVNGGERLLTGEVLRNHFSTPMKVRAKTKSGHTIDLDFRARRTLYLSQINRVGVNYQPHTAAGEYAVKEAQNQVCLSFISQNFDLKPLSDCFSVYALENDTFEMRARDGTTLSYQRANAGFQAEQRMVTQQAPDGLPSPQTFPVIQPSSGSALRPVGASTTPEYVTKEHGGTTPAEITSERRLTGAELRNHFSVPAKVSAKTNNASKLILDFRANRSIYITNPNPPANYPHTNTAAGDYSFRDSENLVCFRVNSLNLTLRALWDCFAVYALENNMFQLRARDGTTISYQRNV